MKNNGYILWKSGMIICNLFYFKKFYCIKSKNNNKIKILWRQGIPWNIRG